MGGMGSGRPRKHRKYLGDCLQLVAGKLREQLGKAGYIGSLTWSRDGEQIAAIGIKTEADALLLDYQANGQTMHERIALEQQARHLGGGQWYFLCPRCGTRREKLYLGTVRFACRECVGLPYRTTSMTDEARYLKTYNRERRRLDPEAGDWIIGHLPERPKGMRQGIYEQIVERALLAEEKREAILDVQLGRMLQRFGKLGLDLGGEIGDLLEG